MAGRGGQLGLGQSHSFPAGAGAHFFHHRAPSAFPEVPAVAPCHVPAPFCSKSSVFATEGKGWAPLPTPPLPGRGKPCRSCPPLRPPPKNLPVLLPITENCKSLQKCFPAPVLPPPRCPRLVDVRYGNAAPWGKPGPRRSARACAAQWAPRLYLDHYPGSN